MSDIKTITAPAGNPHKILPLECPGDAEFRIAIGPGYGPITINDSGVLTAFRTEDGVAHTWQLNRAKVQIAGYNNEHVTVHASNREDENMSSRLVKAFLTQLNNMAIKMNSMERKLDELHRALGVNDKLNGMAAEQLEKDAQDNS